MFFFMEGAIFQTNADNAQFQPQLLIDCVQPKDSPGAQPQGALHASVKTALTTYGKRVINYYNYQPHLLFQPGREAH